MGGEVVEALVRAASYGILRPSTFIILPDGAYSIGINNAFLGLKALSSEGDVVLHDKYVRVVCPFISLRHFFSCSLFILFPHNFLFLGSLVSFVT